MFGLFKQLEKPQDEGLDSESNENLTRELERVRRRATIPTLWLFGKTGSGKSSIVRRLTGSTDAKIGQGFRPETKFSRRYDFPNSEETLLRFLDTRGLGEAFYDPTEDIESFHSSSHLVLVTVRVVDHALDSLIEPLRQIRKASPDRPVLLVLTCLHEASPDRDLSAGSELVLESAGEKTSQVEMGEQLKQLVDLKCKQFEGLFDCIALIDFTHEEDGFASDGFGEHRLKQLILEKLPSAYRQTWAAAMSTKIEGKSELQRRAHWQILASSALSATASAVPLPWVNMPIVLAIQTRMVRKIAWIYDQKMTSRHWLALSNVAGTQVALRLAARELLKFIPFVGIAASIAASFAFTFALGKVAEWYFSVHAQGKTPSDEELKKMFAEQLARGHQLWGTTPK
ncbi:MAG: GTP-binding DUF697 domain-containing protein [Pirellula sp.]|jgi:uncharacterized protein (DUF697 family)|nr:GTP-binding DUF697 domain-containing protein [Pirellula sp.]